MHEIFVLLYTTNNKQNQSEWMVTKAQNNSVTKSQDSTQKQLFQIIKIVIVFILFFFFFFCFEVTQPLWIIIGKSIKLECCEMKLTTIKVDPISNDET